MRRLLFLLSLSFSFFSFCSEEFEDLKQEISANLLSVDLKLQSHIGSLTEGLRQLNDFVIDASGGSGTFNEGYAAGADAAANIVRTRISNCIQDLNLARSEITSSMDVLTDMTAPESPDYTQFLITITNELHALNFHSSNMETKLSEIITILGRLSSGSSGYPALQQDLNTIKTHLSSIQTILEESDTFLSQLYSALAATDGPLMTFLAFSRSRIESPDVNMLDDLAHMWDNTVENFALIVTSVNWSVSMQTSPVASDDTVHLSNEGEIALENLAMNERQYLCSVQALSTLDRMRRDLGKIANSSNNNSNADLKWITNYLDRVQAPYYRIWDDYLYPRYSPVPFATRSGGWEVATNFYDALDRASRNTAYISFKSTYSNWFQRVEMHLMALNGMFYETEDDLTSEEVIHMQDEENIERDLDYSTNSIVEAVQQLSSVSNSFNTVKRKFKELLDAWDIEQGGSSDSIRLLPNIELGEIQIEQIDLTTEDFSFIRDGCRLVFSAIWYVVFGTLSFRYICYLFLCLGRTISRVALIISTLLGK